MSPVGGSVGKMMRRLGLASCLLLSAGRVSAHDPALFDPHRATPGIRLELVEVSPARTAPQVSPGYRLVATGVPRGVTFNVWTKEFAHGYHEVTSGFRMDDAGKLVSVQAGDGRPRYLDEIVFEPGPYFRGAIWEVTLASEDRTITAFTKVVPRPMVARDGPCSVSLKLVSHRGERFLASGAGFVPGEDAVIESRYAGRVNKKQRRVSAEGRLPPDLVSHATVGPDRNARYAVKGRSCEVTVEYEWGDAAFRRY
jgi:hypothetical protein